MKQVFACILVLGFAACTTPVVTKKPPDSFPGEAYEGVLPTDKWPIVVYQVRPFYPKEMADSKTPGEATVDFIIETDGSVKIAKATKATNAQFGESAVNCVKLWRFKPAFRDGVAFRTHLRVPIVFSMQ
jgi:TonB family protein